MSRIRIAGAPFVFLAIAWCAAMGLITWGLWNALMPSIFGLPAVTFGQALGLFFLSRVLFGGFAGWGRRMRRARFVHGWGDLTPEERHRFRQAMHPGTPGSEPSA
jgi:hypothetical protein